MKCKCGYNDIKSIGIALEDIKKSKKGEVLMNSNGRRMLFHNRNCIKSVEVQE